MYTLIVIALVNGLMISASRFYEFEWPQDFYSNSELISKVLNSARIVKFVGDIYLHIVFILVFKYLVEYRR